MQILWFTWKDIKHPFAGGAEAVDQKLAKKLVSEGHTLIMLTGGYPGCKEKEELDGYTVIRVGNQFTVYFEAFRYYRKYLKEWADIIIEEINTIPFLTQFYTKEPRVLLIYQLCRTIWFYQLFFPLNLIGYLIEPIYLWLMRHNTVLTESESTKKDLQRYGFNKRKISVFPVSIDIAPISDIKKKKTFKNFTVLSLGSIRSMKRTLDQVKAFEIAKETIPELKMKISGALVHTYGKKFKEYIKKSKYEKDIEYLGIVSKEEKVILMKQSHLILVTSVKEGWGLIVTEAASQGTPAVVYNVDGLRDSVVQNETGIVTDINTPEAMGNSIIQLYKDKKKYNFLQINALEKSKAYSLQNSYQQFEQLLTR